MDFKKIKHKLKKPRVILVRHGHTDLNGTTKSEDRIRGWIDVPLNKEGIKDGQKAAKKLKNVKVDVILSSDLLRTRQTAEIINQDHQVPIIAYKAFRPWNLGKYNGQLTHKVQHLMDDLIEHPDRVAPDGESFQDFANRYLSILKNVMAEAYHDKKIIVITTHLRNLKLCDGWIKNGMPDDFSVDPEVVINDTFEPGDLYDVSLKCFDKKATE